MRRLLLVTISASLFFVAASAHSDPPATCAADYDCLGGVCLDGVCQDPSKRTSGCDGDSVE